MNSIYKTGTLVAAIVAMAAVVQAGVLIAPGVDRALSGILENPQKVYRVDEGQRLRKLGRIDAVFTPYLKNAKELKKKRRTIQRGEVSPNRAIPVAVPKTPGEAATKLSPKAWYISGRGRRSFVREVIGPAAREMPADDAAALARDYVVRNEFIATTVRDRIGGSFVVSRARKTREDDLKKAAGAIVYQSVHMTRNFLGFEVVNSKQVLDIHPETRELVSYKMRNWSPVDESSGESLPYLTRAEVLRKIEGLFARYRSTVRIVKVKAGMYETERKMVPVIVVYSERSWKDAAGKNNVYRKKSVISLVNEPLPGK